MYSKVKKTGSAGATSLSTVAAIALFLLIAAVAQVLIIDLYVEGNLKYSVISSLVFMLVYCLSLNSKAILGFSVTPSEWVRTAAGKALSGATKQEIAVAANKSILAFCFISFLFLMSSYEKINSQFPGVYEERLFAASVGAAVGVLSGFGIVRLLLRKLK
ncbi:hypothetical protein ACF3M1_08535 [Luteimonas sp. WGS1318]|uniref:hypothetical protein n=1 Tax=Luteimonas sp. WGS1318 TaxID=3366815 RepID=UPI00372D762C